MKTLLSKGILALGVLLTLSLAGGSAQADTFTFTGINTAVTGTVNITKLSNNLLSVTITNTSTGAVTGKMTSIGFDLPGTGTGTFSLASASNPNYRLETQIAGNAAGISRTFEVSLLTGAN